MTSDDILKELQGMSRKELLALKKLIEKDSTETSSKPTVPKKLLQVLEERVERLYHTVAQDKKPPLFLIDLDNTLIDFKWTSLKNYNTSELPKPREGAKELLEGLLKLGQVMLFTQRVRFHTQVYEYSFEHFETLIRQWLVKHDLPDIKVLKHDVPFHLLLISNSVAKVEDYSGHLSNVDTILASAEEITTQYETDKKNSFPNLKHKN